MSPRLKLQLNVFVTTILALGIGLFAYFFAAPPVEAPAVRTPPMASILVNTAAIVQAKISSTTPDSVTSGQKVGLGQPNMPSAITVPTPRPAYQKAAVLTSLTSQTAATNTVSQVAKLESPYTTPPISADTANVLARDAIVNIVCVTSGGVIKPISGSGVIIDPRGIILTNAHVAQYVLLSESPNFGLTCSVRTGSPARPIWVPSVLYIPSIWVDAHAKDINSVDPTGTGEHDYALLYITSSLSGQSIPQGVFPYLPVDTRETIGFPGDQILVASYPVELLGGIVTEGSLYAATTETTIMKLLTFGSGSVDLYSLGGVIEAQSGSSGGAVVNPWGYLIGLIVTTSVGTTTANRDLHSLTLSYIDRDFSIQTGTNLSTFLSEDVVKEFQDFYTNQTLPLIKQYYKALSR